MNNMTKKEWLIMAWALTSFPIAIAIMNAIPVEFSIEVTNAIEFIVWANCFVSLVCGVLVADPKKNRI